MNSHSHRSKDITALPSIRNYDTSVMSGYSNNSPSILSYKSKLQIDENFENP